MLKDEEKTLKMQRKAENKRLKHEKKLEKERMTVQKRQDWKQKRIEKTRQKEEALYQKIANLQLKSELKSHKKESKKNTVIALKTVEAIQLSIFIPETAEAENEDKRPRRQLRKSRHLNEYILQLDRFAQSRT